jgi:hypothetical protein
MKTGFDENLNEASQIQALGGPYPGYRIDG